MTYYDSLVTWLRHAPDDELAEVLYAALTEEQLEEFIEGLDQLLVENPEQ